MDNTAKKDSNDVVFACWDTKCNYFLFPKENIVKCLSCDEGLLVPPASTKSKCHVCFHVFWGDILHLALWINKKRKEIK